MLDFEMILVCIGCKGPDQATGFCSCANLQVLLDYEGVSKAHAEVSLREKLPEEVILGSDVKLPTMLSIRDLTSRNGIGIHKKPEDQADQADQDCIPTIGSFERLQSATSQVQCSNLVVLRCLNLIRTIGLPSQKITEGDVSGLALKGPELK